MNSKRTLILGASTKPSRYAYLALKALVNKGHDVAAVGNKEGSVNGVEIHTEKIDFSSIDTVTLYLSAQNQETYYDYILQLKPRRVIFNPGTQNPAFENKLQQAGILAEHACTLVLLSTNQY